MSERHLSELHFSERHLSELCLVVEPLHIVALDLSMILRDQTGWTPLVVPSVVLAMVELGRLAPDQRLRAAFVYLDEPDWKLSPLNPLLTSLGVPTVLTSPSADPGHCGPGLRVLCRPFGPDHVSRVLASLT